MSSASAASPTSLDSTSQPQAVTLSLICGSCNKPISNQYVRALGSIYHASCFRCLVSSPYPSRFVANPCWIPGLQRDCHPKILLLQAPRLEQSGPPMRGACDCDFDGDGLWLIRLSTRSTTSSDSIYYVQSAVRLCGAAT
jgi:hypothetical protein